MPLINVSVLFEMMCSIYLRVLCVYELINVDLEYQINYITLESSTAQLGAFNGSLMMYPSSALKKMLSMHSNW